MSEREQEDVIEEPEIESPEVEEEGREPEVREPDEYEARAKRMGWVPEDQFRGDKSRWVDAKTFVEKGENELPILRERLRRADEGLKELGEVKETLKQFKGYMTKVEERAYAKAKHDLEAQRQEAKEAGDFDKYEAVTGELHKLETDAKPKEPEVTTPAKDPVFDTWLDENLWFKRDSGSFDKTRAAYATSIGQFLNETEPDLKGKPFLDRVAEAVKKQFPEKFENPRRNGVARVEGGQGTAQRKPGGKSYNDLPPEAKKECDRYVKQELLTREEYAKTYFEG